MFEPKNPWEQEADEDEHGRYCKCFDCQLTRADMLHDAAKDARMEANG